MDRLREAVSLAAVLLLSACSGEHGPGGPTQTPTSVTPMAHAAIARQPVTAALFQPLRGILPYPNDLYFAGSTDGTLNMQPESALLPDQVALNTLDGFSTTAPIRARFDGPLDPASLTPQSVVVLQVSIDNTTKATTGIIRRLVPGIDYTAGVGSEAGAGNAVLEIRPAHPLAPSTGITNNGYLVLLTKELSGAGGSPTVADKDYANIKAALPTCGAIAEGTLHGICKLTGTHLQVARQLGIEPDDVILSFSFSTQSIADSLSALARAATPQPIVVHNTQLTTADVNPHLSGHATLYVGTLRVPYYLSRTAPLTGYWQGGPSPLDAGSRFLTRFNPAPVPTETVQIPVLVSVPNANSAGGGVRPASGWPAVIFQHGIARDRTDMLAVADSFADSGFVVVGIDLPLHGVTDPTARLYASGANPLYAGSSLPAAGSIERTFDLDVLNNATGALGPDGRIDSSGASFINLSSLLTTRDNLRQAAADLITLTRSLPNMRLEAGPGSDLDPAHGRTVAEDLEPFGDIDPADIHFLGHSLGAMVGALYLGVAPSAQITSATLAMPGGGLVELLRESPTLGPGVAARLEAMGLMRGTALFEQYLRDAQTVMDSGDPLNYIGAASAQHPIHLLQIVGSASSPPDQVVPNSATRRLIDAGALSRLPVAAHGAVVNSIGFRTYVNFVVGDHESLIDPTASLATTTEMQAEAITFAGAAVPPIPQLSFPGSPATPPGSSILLLNPMVIQP